MASSSSDSCGSTAPVSPVGTPLLEAPEKQRDVELAQQRAEFAAAAKYMDTEAIEVMDPSFHTFKDRFTKTDRERFNRMSKAWASGETLTHIRKKRVTKRKARVSRKLGVKRKGKRKVKRKRKT